MQTAKRYTGQRFDDAIGLYYYNARYYDPALGRFAQADTIVPEPGNPQSLNRYSYVLNNALRYTDPSGHFEEEAICTYWGYCDEESAQSGLGDMFDMLWNTSITWGDLLFLGDDSDVSTTAMFVLMSYEDGQYTAGLWGLGGQHYGQPVYWDTAKSANKKAAYNAEGNVWEGLVRNEAENWVGSIRKVNGANSLRLAAGVHNWQFATYVDVDGYWALAGAITIAAWVPGGLAAAGVSSTWISFVQGGSIAADVAGLMVDLAGQDWGPVNGTYPVVYYDPLRRGRISSQFHIKTPGGRIK